MVFTYVLIFASIIFLVILGLYVFNLYVFPRKIEELARMIAMGQTRLAIKKLEEAQKLAREWRVRKT